MMNLIKRYNSTTPAQWRKVGNALVAVSVMISGYTVYTDMKVVAIITLVIGIVGKFLTNFFVEDDNVE